MHFMRDFVIFLLFLFLVIIDQISKYIIYVSGPYTLFGLHFELFLNPGIGFSLFAGSSPFLRIVSISTFYGFIMLIFLTAMMLISKRMINLKLGLTILFSGITGNVLDRIHLANVIDFITVDSLHFFNVADMIQMLGLSVVVYSLFRYEKELWYPKNLRKRFKLRSKEQFRLVLKVFFASMMLAITLAIFCCTYFFHILKVIDTDELILFLSIFLFIALSFSVILSLITFVISQRIVGPVLAFNRHISELLNGANKEFSLREGDQHLQLLSIAKNIKEYLYEEE